MACSIMAGHIAMYLSSLYTTSSPIRGITHLEIDGYVHLGCVCVEEERGKRS